MKSKFAFACLIAVGAVFMGCDKHPPREKPDAYEDKKGKPVEATPTPAPEEAPSFFPAQAS